MGKYRNGLLNGIEANNQVLIDIKNELIELLEQNINILMNFIKDLQERFRFDNKILERLRIIFIKIWFMPYSSLDAVTKLAIEEYKKEIGGDKNG